MIHNTHCSLCLEDSAATGEVLLKKCNLDSERQQWVWIAQGMLMGVASSMCLSAQQTKPVQTQSCQETEVDAAGLMWDCDRDRLISRNTSMLLSVDGQHLILTYNSKYSKWRSLDEGDICQEKLSKSSPLFLESSKDHRSSVFANMLSTFLEFICRGAFTACSAHQHERKMT